MENNYKIYLLTMKNGSVYIGRTRLDILSRFKKHRKDAYDPKRPTYSRPLYKLWREIGEPIYEVLECGLSYKDAKIKEHDYTMSYIFMNYNVLNINIGDKLTDVTKGKIRESRIGEKHWAYGKHRSDETKLKLSNALKGERNHFYGKKHTEVSKQKMSEKRKGLCKGANNPSAKPIEYWETHSTMRYMFKKTCKAMGWEFNDFEEVFSDWYHKPSGKRERKFFYKLKQHNKS